jgi:hypothetical protein
VQPATWTTRDYASSATYPFACLALVALPGAYAPTSIAFWIIGERKTPLHDSPDRVNNLLFSTSILALGPSQPPIQRIPVAVSQEAKWQRREADHSPPTSAEIWSWSSSCGRQSVDQFVLVSGLLLGSTTRFYLLFLLTITFFFLPRAPSLTRGRICNLQCNSWPVRSLRTNNHILPSHLRQCSLLVASYVSQGLRWRYSNPSPHGLPRPRKRGYIYTLPHKSSWRNADRRVSSRHVAFLSLHNQHSLVISRVTQSTSTPQALPRQLVSIWQESKFLHTETSERDRTFLTSLQHTTLL